MCSPYGTGTAVTRGRSKRNPTPTVDGVPAVYMPPCCTGPHTQGNMCITPTTPAQWADLARYYAWQAARPQGSTTISPAHYAQWAVDAYAKAGVL